MTNYERVLRVVILIDGLLGLALLIYPSFLASGLEHGAGASTWARGAGLFLSLLSIALAAARRDRPGQPLSCRVRRRGAGSYRPVLRLFRRSFGLVVGNLLLCLSLHIAHSFVARVHAVLDVETMKRSIRDEPGKRVWPFSRRSLCPSKACVQFVTQRNYAWL